MQFLTLVISAFVDQLIKFIYTLLAITYSQGNTLRGVEISLKNLAMHFDSVITEKRSH